MPKQQQMIFFDGKNKKIITNEENTIKNNPTNQVELP